MRLLLLSAILSLVTTSSSWAWPPRTYVMVAPAYYGPLVTYAQPAPPLITYAQPAPPLITYAQPAIVPYAQPAIIPQAYAQPPAPNDDATALARLQAEIRQLTQEANVRSLQSRVLELEKRQAAAPPK